MTVWRTLAIAALIMAGIGRLCAQDAVDISKFPNPCHLYLQSDRTLCIDFKYRVGKLTAVSPDLSQKFRIVAGLASNQGISFESLLHPGSYVRHANYLLHISQPSDDDPKLPGDATFLVEANPKTPEGLMFHPYSWWPDLFAISVTRDNLLYVAPNPRYADCTFVIAP